MAKHKPVCIHKDGIFVINDVGWLYGFISFLKEAYDGDHEEEQNNIKAWAQSLGWSERKISNRLVLRVQIVFFHMTSGF